MFNGDFMKKNLGFFILKIFIFQLERLKGIPRITTNKHSF